MVLLASERALDSLCLATGRAKLSHGQLSEVREYQAANKIVQRIYRPCINGVNEDMTQRDMDILRAVITKFLADGNCYPFIKADPATTVMTCPDTIGDRDELLNRVIDGTAIEIEITPQQIRQLLQKRKDVQDTAGITHSLKKWEALRLEGLYKVRMADSKAKDVSINGNLLHVEVGKGKNRSAYYQIIFATKWGRLFMHNVQSGNLNQMRDEKYPKWGDVEKSIYYTVFSFPQDDFWRRPDELLSILNIKVGKNRQRAINKLDQSLNRLQEMGYLEWNCNNTAYHIKRKRVPQEKSKAPNGPLAGQETYEAGEQKESCIDNTMEAIAQLFAKRETQPYEAEKEYYSDLAITLGRKADKTIEEKAQLGIIESVERLSRGLPKGWEPDDTLYANVKMVRLGKWEDYSPYYLWLMVEKHEYFRKKLEQAGAKEVFNIYNLLNNNEELKRDIRDFIDKVEKAYKVYCTLSAEEAAM